MWRLTCRHNHRIVHRQCPIDRHLDRHPESCYYLALAHGPPPFSCYTTAEPPHLLNLPTRPTLLSTSLSSPAASRSAARALLPSPTPPLRTQNKETSTNSISKMVQQKQQALQQHPLSWVLRMSADHCKRGRRGGVGEGGVRSSAMDAMHCNRIVLFCVLVVLLWQHSNA